MHARITQVRILPGKVQQFAAAVDALLPAARKQAGFRGLFILRGGEDDKPEATLISIWESLADLRASEGNMFYYEGLSNLFTFCDGYPLMHEEEILAGEFTPQHSSVHAVKQSG